MTNSNRFKSVLRQKFSSKLFRDSFWALFGNSIGKVLALLLGIILANLLGSEDFGKYGLIKNSLFYLSICSTFGLGITGTKYIAQYKEEKNKINNICHDILTISVGSGGSGSPPTETTAPMIPSSRTRSSRILLSPLQI